MELNFLACALPSKCWQWLAVLRKKNKFRHSYSINVTFSIILFENGHKKAYARINNFRRPPKD